MELNHGYYLGLWRSPGTIFCDLQSYNCSVCWPMGEGAGYQTANFPVGLRFSSDDPLIVRLQKLPIGSSVEIIRLPNGEYSLWSLPDQEEVQKHE